MMAEEILKEIAYPAFIIQKNKMVALLVVIQKKKIGSGALAQNQRQSRAPSSSLRMEAIVVTINLLALLSPFGVYKLFPTQTLSNQHDISLSSGPSSPFVAN